MMRKWGGPPGPSVPSYPIPRGVGVYSSVPDKCTTPPVLSFLVYIIYKHRHTHSIPLPPLYMENAGTCGPGGPRTSGRFKQVIESLNHNALDNGFFISAFSEILLVFPPKFSLFSPIIEVSKMVDVSKIMEVLKNMKVLKSMDVFQ